MKRRTAIKIVALSAVSSNLDPLTHGLCHSEAGTACSAGNYNLRFFTPEENQLLDQLMEMVIPADGHSPGAHAAQVSLFADLMLSISSAAVQKQWREGLKLIQEESAKSSLAEALAKSAANEGHPTNDLERFFRALKHMTANGYYTSTIGIHQDLQYQGNAYLTAFPRCAQVPAKQAEEPGKEAGAQLQARSSPHFCNK